jgi:drug/metabolite transporter, DME family
MHKQGILFILGGALLWGTTGTAQALAPQGAQPLAIGSLRLVVGGLALLAYFFFTREPFKLEKRDILPLLLAAVCMAAYQVLFFAGVKRTGVAVGTIVGIGSSPVLAGVLGYWFRKEPPGWRWGAATLLAVAGCALLALTGAEIHVDLLGMLLAVGAGGAYATFSLASKGLLERRPVSLVMAASFCLAAVLLSPLLFTQDLSWLAQPRGVLVILHLGILATATAYILFGQGLRRVGLAHAVTLSLAEPLTAGLLGVFLLGESLSVPAGVGIALIFGGLAVLALRPAGAAAPVEQTG